MKPLKVAVLVPSRLYEHREIDNSTAKKESIRIKDRVVLTILAGGAAALIANTFGYLTKWIYPSTVVMPEVATELFVDHPLMHTLAGEALGNLWSMTVGGLHALVYILALDLTGWRYLWLKSFAVTSAGWLIGVGVLFRAFGIASEAHKDLLSVFLFYLAHLVYLTVSAYIVGRFGVPKEDRN